MRQRRGLRSILNIIIFSISRRGRSLRTDHAAHDDRVNTLVEERYGRRGMNQVCERTDEFFDEAGFKQSERGKLNYFNSITQT
jgi:hypothetical protein